MPGCDPDARGSVETRLAAIELQLTEIRADQALVLNYVRDLSRDLALLARAGKTNGRE